MEILGEAGESEGIEPLLGLAGEVHQDHAHDVTGVPVAVAGDDDAVAMDFFARPTKKVDRHFGPKAERVFGAKLEAVFANADVGSREADLRPILPHGGRLENPRGV